MNIAVCVKSAIDEGELGADPFGAPRIKGAETKINAFDRNGVEEALRQREVNGGTVTVVTLGTADSRKAVKEALAMGADKATLILADVPPDALGTAWGLAKGIRSLVGGVDLVICSEGSADTYQGQVGAMVAEFMDLPFLPYAKKIAIAGGVIRCEANSEAGIRVSEAGLPAVVSVVPETNIPRYPTLLQLMNASKKPIDEVQFSSLIGTDYPDTGTEVLDVRAQPADRKRVLFEGSPDEEARKLVAALKQEGVI
ncbi:MAG: electron transfer flavoprotein subunit beta/FixA family protein [Thaumarchaeota archaeon]|nr:electron transfer flavoprotein subunit beta/FixA family protein [Nitrososphaerota archaeon]